MDSNSLKEVLIIHFVILNLNFFLINLKFFWSKTLNNVIKFLTKSNINYLILLSMMLLNLNIIRKITLKMGFMLKTLLILLKKIFKHIKSVLNSFVKMKLMFQMAAFISNINSFFKISI